MRFLSLAQDIKSMTMLCPDHLEDAGRLGKLESLYPDYWLNRLQNSLFLSASSLGKTQWPEKDLGWVGLRVRKAHTWHIDTSLPLEEKWERYMIVIHVDLFKSPTCSIICSYFTRLIYFAATLKILSGQPILSGENLMFITLVCFLFSSGQWSRVCPLWGS